MKQVLHFKFLFLFFSFLLSTLFSKIYCQQFSNNSTSAITDNGSIAISIPVNGLSAIDTTNFGLESVVINISHPADKELIIQLESPDGTTILLAKNLGGSDFENTTFNGKSNRYIDFGTAPYNGQFRPLNDLSILNNSQSGNGAWKLIVRDNLPGNTGSIRSVALQFGNQPAKPILSSSNLPIIKINTNGKEIVDEPKIIADMSIIDNGPGKTNHIGDTHYSYQGKIGIEIRGHSSQMFPKKQFGFETRDATGNDDVDVSLLGLPAESDWILSANYSDKTMMRNILSYQLSREMGHYASRTVYCEVIIDNEYKGVFVLMEKIKKDKNRVDIEKLKSSDIAPPNVTGGYIFSIDKLDGGEVTWHSSIQNSITFQFVYPKKPEDIEPQQKDYIESYVDSFEQALNGKDFQDPNIGFRKYIDVKSFMDFFIINELARNIDGFRLSSYFHKPREEKIIAGPVWDFDIAWGNANYYNGSSTEGYVYSYNYPKNDYLVPFWWKRFMEDDLWKQNLICRYDSFRENILSNQHINHIIDSLANKLQYAQQRNFIRWDILGEPVWPNPEPLPQTYSAEVTYLKNWISKRLSFLDGDLGPCTQFPLSSPSLITLEGKNVNATNQLVWTTNAEPESDYFIVESSSDNHTFIQIGKVDGNGPSNTIKTYIFKDENILAPVTYYRIKLMDKYGNISYSPAVPISFENSVWHLYPNKVHEQLKVFSPIKNDQTVSFLIYNMMGQRIRSIRLANSPVITQDISSLASGNYILQIIDAGGKKTNLYFLKN